MNKAEELKQICFKWLWKAFETGTKQDPFSADNSEYWHPAIDLKWSKEMADELEQYAQQVSREKTVEFVFDHTVGITKDIIGAIFDEWMIELTTKTKRDEKPNRNFTRK